MKSLNKAIIGMLAATAMIAGPFATVASASEAGPQVPGSQSETSTVPSAQDATSAKPNESSKLPAAQPSSSATPAADQSAKPDKSAKPSESSKTENPKTTPSTSTSQPSAPGKSESSDKSASSSASPKTSEPSSQQSPDHTAQPTPAPQIEEPEAQGGECSGTGTWNRSPFVYVSYRIVQEPEGCTVHFGSGTLGYTNNAPFRQNSAITRIVFDEAVNPSDDDMYQMFCNLPKITAIEGLKNIKGITTLNQTFTGDSQLVRLDVAGWDTSNVTRMDDVFNGDSKLEKLDLTGWNTSKVTNMQNMFSGNSALTEIKGISDLNTSAVTNMTSIFNGVPLRSLNLRSWDTQSVTDMSSAFSNMKNLKNLEISNWNVSLVKTMSSMFYGDPELSSLSVSAWHPDALKDASSMFNGDVALASLDLSGWKDHTQNLETINSMFNGGSSDTSRLESLTGLAGWDVSRVTDMGSAFASLPKITVLDLSGWKPTLGSGGLQYAFSDDTGLTKIEGLSSFNTSGVVSMEEAFSGDTELKKLDLSGWDTGNILIGNAALPPYLNEIKLGPNTKLSPSYFGYSCFGYNEPSAAGAEEPLGYTGRWTQDDNNWTSVESQGDDESFSEETTKPGFAGGTFVWQEFAEVSFDGNLSENADVTGTTDTIRKVDAYVSNISISIPASSFNSGTHYDFKNWNTAADGSGAEYEEGEMATGFTRGNHELKLYARWTPASPSTPDPTPMPDPKPKPPAPLPKPPSQLPKPPKPAPAPAPAPNKPTPKPPTPAPTKPKPKPEPAPTPETPAAKPEQKPSPTNPAPQTPIAPVNTLPASSNTLPAASAPLAAAPAAQVLAPAPRAVAPAPRANANVTAPAAPAAPAAPQPQQQPARPKCIPEDVYRKIQANKRGTKPVDWIEYGDSSADVQPAAWKLSDYNGLTRCEVEASAPSVSMARHFSFWWLLVFLVPLFLLFLAYRNGGYIVARHRNFDSVTIRK